jgi:hypothetical protein
MLQEYGTAILFALFLASEEGNILLPLFLFLNAKTI